MRFSSFIYLVGQGLHSMKANRLMTFASMGVLTVCMILVGTAFLFGVNIDAVVQYMGSRTRATSRSATTPPRSRSTPWATRLAR